MSMLEIQEMTRRKARTASDLEKFFEDSSKRFLKWLPSEHRPGINDKAFHLGEVAALRSHPVQPTELHNHVWALRVTARPLSSLELTNVSKENWLQLVDNRAFGGKGQFRQVWSNNLQFTRAWQPRLRAVEREFRGPLNDGLHRITSEGAIERFIIQGQHLKEMSLWLPKDAGSSLECCERRPYRSSHQGSKVKDELGAFDSKSSFCYLGTFSSTGTTLILMPSSRQSSHIPSI